MIQITTETCCCSLNIQISEYEQKPEVVLTELQDIVF